MRIFSKKWFHTSGKLIYATFNGFIDDNGLKHSASLAYYTVFSLAPLMMLIVFIVSIYYGHDAFSGQIYPQLKGFLGADAAGQIQEMIKSLQRGKSTITIIIGIITVIVGGTGVFLDMQDSLNIIWRVKAKPKRGWVKMLANRLLSFSLVIGLSFLLLVSLIVNTVVDALSERLSLYFHQATVVIFQVINLGISFVVIATLFAIIFKFLPDVKIQWSNVRMGAFFTAALFMLGKYAIGVYIASSKLSSTYGAAGSIIIIFVWIYYASALLYLGAEFTEVYSEYKCEKIEPADYAVSVEQKEVERVVAALPAQNPDIKAM